MPSISEQDFDSQWVLRAQQGEPEAQQQIYLYFAPQVLRLARHMLQCEAAAEEVVQDCFVDLLCKIDQFRHQGSFAGWLRRMAVNHCLMALRSAWHKKRDSIPDANQLTDDSQIHTGSADATDHHAHRLLNSVLARLPAKTRAVLWLHDVEDYTHGEIAKMMGKSVSFSKSQLARAHEKIRQQLAAESLERPQPVSASTSPSSSGAKPCMPLLNNF